MTKRFSSSKRLLVVVVAMSTLAAVCGGSSWATTKHPATKVTVVNGVPVSVNAAAAKLVPSAYRSLISIVTSAPFPPFEQFGPNEKLEGLDIDTGNALAAVLGTKAQFSSIDFNGVIPALQAGKYNLLLADTGDDAERAGALNFVEYSLQGEVLVVPAANPHHITSFKSMCGLTLSVESGDNPTSFFNPIQSYCASVHRSPVTIKSLPTTADALLALMSGSAQAQFVGVGAAPSLAKDVNGKVKIVNVPRMTGGYNALYVGVGLPKSSPLLSAVKAGMKVLLADGVLRKLFTKYGLQATLLPSVKVNAIGSGGGSTINL